MKKKVTSIGILLSLGILCSGMLPLSNVVHAEELNSKEASEQNVSDIKDQFNLTDSYLEGIDKTGVFIPTKEQTDKINNLLRQRAFGIDDVVILIGIVGTGYAAGHWAGSEAHKRFGLSISSYKSNRWWWRAGIAAAAGVPAVVGFDDYFYGI